MEKTKWHGAGHYTNKIHLAFLVFLILGALTIYGSYQGINDIREREVENEVEKTAPSPSVSPSPRPSPSPSPSPTIPEGIVCTLDVRICPDGSSVPRSGPNCEFVCPTISPN